MKKTILFALIASAFHVQAQIPTANLEAHYPFNGNANDESLNTNNGVVNGASLTTDRFGNPSSAYNFDGVDDYISIAAPSWQTNAEGSFSIWAKFDDLSSRNLVLGKQGNNASPGAFHETVEIGTNGDRLWYRGYDSNGGLPEIDVDVPSIPLVINNWYHFTITVSTTNGTKLYINGQEVPGNFGTGSSSLSYWFNDFMGTYSEWQIGTTKQYYNQIDNPTDGVLDDIRIYSDELTACEVWALYLEGLDLDDTESVDVCEGSDYTFPDGSVQTNLSSNVVYTSYFPSVLTACDSASIETTINVNPLPTVTASGTATICEGQSTSLTAGGALTYTWDNSAGTGSPVSVSPSTTTTYTVTGTDSNTCTNMAQVTVTVNPLPDVTVSQSGLVLTAQNVNAGITYQWVDCNNSYDELSGETNQVHTATVNGSYAVVINENGCADTSSCYNVTSVGIIENDFGNKLIVYPNPTNGDFSVDLGEDLNTVNISMADLNGKLIQSNTYNNSQLLNFKIQEPAGIYLLMIESGDKKAVIRLVKK